jgi:predicted GNAT superfamily acetyltransferase
MYGPGTDRVIVEWDLTRERPRVLDDANLTRLVMPTEKAELRRSFDELLGKGLVAVSCRRQPDRTAAYYFGPVDDA